MYNVCSSKFYIFLEDFKCPADHAKCPSSYCVAAYKVCDGTVDCPNGEDEHNCRKPYRPIHRPQHAHGYKINRGVGSGEGGGAYLSNFIIYT